MSDNDTQFTPAEDTTALEQNATVEPPLARAKKQMKQPTKEFFRETLKQAQHLLAKNLQNLPAADADEVEGFLKATGYQAGE